MSVHLDHVQCNFGCSPRHNRSRRDKRLDRLFALEGRHEDQTQAQIHSHLQSNDCPEHDGPTAEDTHYLSHDLPTM